MIRHRATPARRSPRRRQPSWAADVARRRAGRAFEAEQGPLIERVLDRLAATAPDLGRWLALGLALLTVATLQLWRGARSGHGWLTLCALSRTLPLDETEKARSKRLYGLLRNAALDGTAMTPLLVRLALGDCPRGWIPIVVDQITIRGTPVLMAGVRVAHRVLPVASSDGHNRPPAPLHPALGMGADFLRTRHARSVAGGAVQNWGAASIAVWLRCLEAIAAA